MGTAHTSNNIENSKTGDFIWIFLIQRLAVILMPTILKLKNGNVSVYNDD